MCIYIYIHTYVDVFTIIYTSPHVQEISNMMYLENNLQNLHTWMDRNNTTTNPPHDLRQK